MIVRRQVLIAAATAVMAGVVLQAARADIGVVSVAPATARPGTSVVVTVGGIYAPLSAPVYVVPLSQMPRYASCGSDRVCAPQAASAPNSWPYSRVGIATFSNKGVVRFRVPRLAAGRYGLVVYCAPCRRGPGGSLLPGSVALRVVR